MALPQLNTNANMSNVLQFVAANAANDASGGDDGGNTTSEFSKELLEVAKEQLAVLHEIKGIVSSMLDMQADALVKQGLLDKQGLEDSRELGKESNESSGPLLTAVKVSAAAILGAWALGFVGELLIWGDKVKEAWEKVLTMVKGWGVWKFHGESITKVFNAGWTKMAGWLKTGWAKLFEAVPAKFTELFQKIVAPIKALAGWFKELEVVKLLMPFLQSAGGISGIFAKIFPTFTKLAKLGIKGIPIIGEIVMIVEGIMGAFSGFKEGYASGGILGGIKEGFIGMVDGVMGDIVDMLTHALGWTIEKLGDMFGIDFLKDIGATLKEFDFASTFGTLVDQMTWAIECLLTGVMNVMKKGVGMYVSLADKLHLGGLVPDAIRKWSGSTSDMPANPGVRAKKEGAAPAPAASGGTPAAPAAAGGTPAAPAAPAAAGGTPAAPAASGGAAPATAGKMTSGGSSAALASGATVEGIDADALWKTVSPMIAEGESGKGGYDAQNGVKGSVTPGLSDMTIQEVHDASLKIGRSDGNGDKTGAAGKYQFIPTTLMETMKMAKMKPTDKFSPANQEKLARARFDWRVKLGKKGGVTGVLDQLAMEWASLPSPSKGGASWWGGVAGNKAHGGKERLNQLTAAVSGASKGGVGGGSGAMVASSGGAPSAPSASPSSGGGARSSGSAISTATAAVGSSGGSSSRGHGGNSSVNAPTNITNQTTNISNDLAASTPVAFAAHVV